MCIMPHKQYFESGCCNWHLTYIQVDLTSTYKYINFERPWKSASFIWRSELFCNILKKNLYWYIWLCLYCQVLSSNIFTWETIALFIQQTLRIQIHDLINKLSERFGDSVPFCGLRPCFQKKADHSKISDLNIWLLPNWSLHLTCSP